MKLFFCFFSLFLVGCASTPAPKPSIIEECTFQSGAAMSSGDYSLEYRIEGNKFICERGNIREEYSIRYKRPMFSSGESHMLAISSIPKSNVKIALTGQSCPDVDKGHFKEFPNNKELSVIKLGSSHSVCINFSSQIFGDIIWGVELDWIYAKRHDEPKLWIGQR